jgi:hypothetical protein
VESFYWLTLGVLGVWRITHLLNAEDGPADMLVRLRQLAGSGFWGGLLDCFYCLSLWVAAPFAVLIGGEAIERLLLWPALSSGAILLERITRETPVSAAMFVEDKENSGGVLRKEQGPGADTESRPHPGDRAAP